jgi:hypothetical protein
MAQNGRFFAPHTNMCLHSTAATIEAIRQPKFKLFPHILYKLDLGPLDCHLFGSQKEALHGLRFTSDNEFKDAVCTWR